MNKLYLHCDMNNYFASVETIYDETLKDIPFIVAGDPATRHGIVLASNYHAKKYSIMAGESIYSALSKYPNLKVIIADYSKYITYAKKSRNIYQEYSNLVIPYGLDEAWLVIDNIDYERGQEIADEIRLRFKQELQLTISVGVSFNYIFSKLASDQQKPDATTVLRKSELQTIIWKIPAFELLYVGKSTRNKLKNMGILTIGDLANADIRLLKGILGKVGITLHQFANGDDSSFSPAPPVDIPFKNISNTITLPRDIVDEIDILSLIYVLANVVTSRLHKHTLMTKCLGLNFKYHNFETINRHFTLNSSTDNKNEIYSSLLYLFKKNYKKQTPIRSIGVSLTQLSKKIDYQLEFADLIEENNDDIEKIIVHLKKKFGKIDIEKVAINCEDSISINNLLEGD